MYKFGFVEFLQLNLFSQLPLTDYRRKSHRYPLSRVLVCGGKKLISQYYLDWHAII